MAIDDAFLRKKLGQSPYDKKMSFRLRRFGKTNKVMFALLSTFEVAAKNRNRSLKSVSSDLTVALRSQNPTTLSNLNSH